MAPKKVLIVDDALELGRLLKATLNTLNNELDVAVVSSLAEALAVSDKSSLDLLITDLKLPAQPGIELLQKVRAKHSDVRVIAVTSLSDDQIPKAVKDLHIDFKLKKPMEIDEFLTAAKACLGLTEGEVGEAKTGTTGQVQELFAQLKADLNAIAICLVDVNGSVTARAGDFPEKNFESRWIPAILSSISSDAKILHLFTTPTGDGVHAYMGPTFHLIFMTVDENVLIALLKPEQGHSHLLMSIGVVIEAQRELLMILSGKKPVHQAKTGETAGNSQKKAAVESVAVVVSEKESTVKSTDLDEFEARLVQMKPVLANEDMDKFWDTAEEDDQTGQGTGIRYEEAKKLGLVEKAAKEKRK